MEELYEAVQSSDLSKVQRLLRVFGTNVNILDKEGLTPLCYACISGNTDIAAKLLDAEAAVDLTGAQKWGPLQIAAFYGHDRIVSLLLDHGANKNAFGENPSPLRLACASPRGLEAAKLLIAAGADLKQFLTKAPLHEAAEQQHPGVLTALLEAGAYVNAKASELLDFKHDPLSIIASINDVVEGDTPLHCAARGAHPENVKLLLSYGADPDAVNRFGETPLLCSIQTGPSLEVASLLVGAGANVHIKDKDGHTPLRMRYRLHQVCFKYDFHGVYLDFPFRCFNLLLGARAREWECVPQCCPGLENVLFPVWLRAPDGLPELAKRLPKMKKELIQKCLRVLHGRLPEELRIQVVAAALALPD